MSAGSTPSSCCRERADAAHVKAELKDGELTLVVPKAAATEPEPEPEQEQDSISAAPKSPSRERERSSWISQAQASAKSAYVSAWAVIGNYRFNAIISG